MYDDLAYATVFDLRARRVSSALLTEVLLARIAEMDTAGAPTAINSVLAVSATAPDDARARDAEDAQGPLHGIPVLVKDNIEAVGLPGTAGSTSLVGRPPTADAPVVGRLRAAGAVILGATNLSEWANIRSPHSTSGWSAVGGLTTNPWAPNHSAGGSSSGSGAAVAAGFAPAALGTETDGSITCPAAVNGVAGIKPTVGTVPTAGIVPISASQDSPGPMARTVAEVALLLEIIAATPGIVDRVRAGVGGLRVGVARAWRTQHPGTDALFDETVGRLRAAGAEVVDVAVPVPTPADGTDEFTVLLCELLDGLGAYLPTRGPHGPQSLAEVIDHEQAHAAVELAHFGHEFFEQAVALGGTASAAYREARSRNLRWAIDGCLGPATAVCDVLVAPSYGPALPIDLAVGGHPAAASPVTMAPAIAGWPIATAPIGLVDHLPVGLAAVGPPGSEPLLLAVCAAVEQPMRPPWRPPA